MEAAYKDSGIWTMQSARTSCVVPEQPLLISLDEEIELNALASAVWRAVETLAEVVEFSEQAVLRKAKDQATNMPDGLTMPPSIRVDIVRTKRGPRIVEIDPITAISLGETAFLTSAWRGAGYQTVASPVQSIVQRIVDIGANELAADLPQAKQPYTAEVDYLLEAVNAELPSGASPGQAASLSAFMEVPARRRSVNKQIVRWEQNPLWGSLVGLADKSNLQLLSNSYPLLSKFLAQELTIGDISEMPDGYVVAKPIKGTGSSGIQLVTPREAKSMQKDSYIFQESLEPVEDYYGESMGPGWISRLSIYAGRCGLEGAQVTARQSEGAFTNVHGQADAIQTTLAITQS